MTFWDFLEFSGIARQIAVVQPLRAVMRRQLRSSVFDRVSTNDVMAMWEDCFAHLQTAAGDGGGRRRRSLFFEVERRQPAVTPCVTETLIRVFNK
jgi:hypothetical protein